MRVEQPFAPDANPYAINPSMNAFAGMTVKFLHRTARQSQLTLPRLGDDWLAKRMLASLLDRGGQAKHEGFIDAVRRPDVGYGGFAFGQCAGFVEGHRGHLAK